MIGASNPRSPDLDETYNYYGYAQRGNKGQLKRWQSAQNARIVGAPASDPPGNGSAVGEVSRGDVSIDEPVRMSVDDAVCFASGSLSFIRD